MGYMPYSTHQLNIFEPRYRQLYDDILFSGSRRFVVTSVHPDGDRFAEVGVVLYLTDLKDVSEQTSDEVKYVCDHEVIGRVRIRRVLNPGSWEDGSTYLRVETEPVEDEDDAGEDLGKEEAEVMGLLGEVSKLQKELDVAQISPSIAKHLNASRAKTGGLWSLISLWAEYYDFLMAERRGILDEDMQREYWSHVGEDEGGAESSNWDEEDDDDDDIFSIGDDEDADTLFVEDMPPPLQAKMEKMHDQFEEEMESMLLAQAELVQLALQSTSHRERLALLRDAFEAERRRLAARLVVKEAVLESTAKATKPEKPSAPKD